MDHDVEFAYMKFYVFSINAWKKFKQWQKTQKTPNFMW